MEIADRFAQLAPWIFQFRIGGADFGGKISALGDVRLAQFWKFAPEARRILELGALEGAHTVQLAERAQEVVAIEGRAANIRKAKLVTELLAVRGVRFIEGNLETMDLAALGTFDAVFCSGLLYHLPEPWKLIAQLPRLAPRLFIWTHYAEALGAQETRADYRGKVHVEGGPDEPLSGLSATAFWPTLGSLMKMLSASGYRTLELIQHEPTHQNSPAITLGASVHDYLEA